jgi:hypothetical protein
VADAAFPQSSVEKNVRSVTGRHALSLVTRYVTTIPLAGCAHATLAVAIPTTSVVRALSPQPTVVCTGPLIVGAAVSTTVIACTAETAFEHVHVAKDVHTIRSVQP